MFGVRKLYEQRIEDLKAEHVRMVKLMADEIEYLRSQIIGPRQAAAYRRPESDGSSDGNGDWDFMPPARTSPHFMTEEEEDLRALHEGGVIEDFEFRKAMAALGKAVGGVPITEGDNDPHASEFFGNE